ncbi:hypothetical protein HU200_066654 [Digitaria exilis]|uniref:BHLH domain-containing protein n=1 Tax=Digitaria exilis TaxID=1010633 RepID=A0A834ZWK0_9POAL|nr:hypothetical protein HU200_066654 [Digitaria exilis]CAB3475758.1 unnamed protein product [Digitaria exilis]
MGSVPFSDAGLFDGVFYGGFDVGHGYGHGEYEYGLAGQQVVGASTSSPVVLDGGVTTEEADVAAAADASAAELDAPPERKGDDRRSEKAAMALKSHSEAERRRRERINAHLATLRNMVPSNDKVMTSSLLQTSLPLPLASSRTRCTPADEGETMDKAALLAEVITHVKKLKTSAARIRSHCAVPADDDDVTVELVAPGAATPSPSPSHGGGVLVKATLSCDDGADVYADVKSALRPLGLRVVGSEVTMLGGRVRFTFLMSSSPCGGGGNVSGGVADSVRQALQSVIDKANSALEFAPRTSLLNKRRRVSTFESSSSSS